MRPVEYFEYDYKNRKEGENAKLIKVGEGKFHEFGLETEEYENGASNYTIAIIELEDGSITTCYPHMMKFIDAKDMPF